MGTRHALYPSDAVASNSERSLLTVTGAARRLGVHVNTVRAWTDQGRLSCLRINDRGDRRYPVEELDRFLARAGGGRRLGRPGQDRTSSPSAPEKTTPSPSPRPTTAAQPAQRGADAAEILTAIATHATHAADAAELLNGVTETLSRAGYSGKLLLVDESGVTSVPGRPSPDERVTAGQASVDRRLVAAALRRERPARGMPHGRPLGRVLAIGLGADERGTLVLQLSRPEPGPFSQRVETSLLTGVAAIIRSRLSADEHRRVAEEKRRHAELLLAAGGQISSQLDLPRSLSHLARYAMELFAADHAAIFRHVPEGRFVGEVALNLSPDVVERIERAGSVPLIRRAFENGEIAWSADNATDADSAEYRAELVAHGIETVTVAPLISEDERLGVLVLFHDRRYRWRPEALTTLKTLARQGAVAVRNARNYGQMATWAAQLQSIQQLGSRLTRLTSVHDIGQAIAAELHQLIDYHNVRVYRVVGEEVIPVAWRGEVGEYVGEDGEQLRVRVGQGITGWVARYGLAQNLGDAARDQRTQTIPGTEDDLDESLLLAPMLYEDQVIGVIVLAKLGLRQFTSDDLRLLEIYASIAAQAMANADATEMLRAKSSALERQLQSQRELLRVTESILGTLDTQALLEEIAERLGSLLEVDNIGVDLYDQATGLLHPIFARGVYAEEYLSRKLRDDEGIGGLVVRTGEALLVQDEMSDPRVAHFDELGPVPGALIVTPLRGRERVAGALTIERLGDDARFTEEEFELVKLFAGHVSIALNNAAAHRAVEIRAETDALTGLRNQGSLTVDLERAVGRGDPFALLMLDLDHFKLFNDRRGHQAGNVMLGRLSSLLRAACRETDVVFRYGGDEFAVLLPGTSAEGAAEVATKVAEAVRSVTDGRRPPIVVTSSIGMASYPDDGVDAASVLLAADRACYAAKRKGRDRIATAAEGLALADEFLPAPTPVDEPEASYSAV